jgi:peptidyl-prolyl cis-trans isomerase SurA
MKFIMIKIILLLILFFFNTATFSLENKILFKINNEIITTIDIYKEVQYLKIINPKINELEKEKIYEIAKNSLVKDKIKEIELKNNFKNLKIDNSYYELLLNNFSKERGFVSVSKFREYIEINNLDIKNIEKKIKYEVLWNRLIVKKFLNKVKIDKEQIINDLKKNNKQTEYLLSEIIFDVENKNKFKEKLDLIKKDINDKSFQSAATIHGISDTAPNGGLIGWVKKSSLNPLIQDRISKIGMGNITEPIIIPGGFLILKIDDIRITNKEFKSEDEIKSIIDAKTNEQLSQYSIIYFNKIKKETQIDEL